MAKNKVPETLLGKFLKSNTGRFDLTIFFQKYQIGHVSEHFI